MNRERLEQYLKEADVVVSEESIDLAQRLYEVMEKDLMKQYLLLDRRIFDGSQK